MYAARTARWATIGFVVVAALVLGGLTWATVASLTLERNTRLAQAREEVADRLKLAMWRIDSEVSPALGLEFKRPYYEYTSYYLPQTLHYVGGSEPAVDVLQESPLLDSENLEPWIVLHFQHTDYEQWTSPQLPSPDKWPQIEVLPPMDAAAQHRKELLRRLANADSTRRFAEEIDKASTIPGGADDQVKIVNVPSLRRTGDFGQRLLQVTRLQKLTLPKVLECEPGPNILNVVGEQAQHPAEVLPESDGYQVRVGDMVPLWLTIMEGQPPELVFVRRVRVTGDLLAYQGFIVDWHRLAKALPISTSLGELFSTVRLEPDYVPLVPHEPAALMTRLPLRLVVSEPRTLEAASTWTSTRTTLAFAWVAAIIALIAVGLGVRGLVALTARRTEFTYAVTHELRTPLTTFQLYTDMLASGLVPEEKKALYLQTLNQESRRLSDLVAEVLEFSRIESNAVRTNPGTHTVKELMDSINERYASRCAAAGVQLSLDPNGSADRKMHTDLHIALQIVGTLIDNACKYVSAPSGANGATGSEPPRVRIAAYPAPHRLAIEVADNGPGIAPQDRADLFQPFRRGSQAEGSKAGGVGLGLALAKRWSRLIHSHLELVDHPELPGACFRLTIPAE